MKPTIVSAPFVDALDDLKKFSTDANIAFVLFDDAVQSTEPRLNFLNLVPLFIFIPVTDIK